MNPHQNESGHRARRELSPIKVWVNETEKAHITARAASAGLSVSSYLRTVGLNHRITSRCDLDAAANLGRVNGDLGRIAGLLKLWLAERRGQGAPPIQVETLMKDFRALQSAMSTLMHEVLK